MRNTNLSIMMEKSAKFTLLAMALVAVTACTTSTQGTSAQGTSTQASTAEHPIDGTWKGDVSSQQGQQTVIFEFKVEDGQLTGTAKAGPRRPQAIENASIEGNSLSFKQKQSTSGYNITFAYKGELNGDEIQFSRGTEVAGYGSQGEVTFTATRQGE